MKKRHSGRESLTESTSMVWPHIIEWVGCISLAVSNGTSLMCSCSSKPCIGFSGEWRGCTLLVSRFKQMVNVVWQGQSIVGSQSNSQVQDADPNVARQHFNNQQLGYETATAVPNCFSKILWDFDDHFVSVFKCTPIVKFVLANNVICTLESFTLG